MPLAATGLRPFMRSVVITSVLLVAMVSRASAYVVVLNAIKTGLYSSNGGYDGFSYVTGIQLSWAAEMRGFVAFDLSSLISGTVQSAVLSVANPESVNQVGPNDPLELRLFGLTTMDAANAGGPGQTTTNAANFAYIGGGLAPHYATQMVNPLSAPAPVVFSLTGQALTDLETALQTHDAFTAFGFKIIKADAQEPKPLQYVFGGTDLGGTVTLTLDVTPVPEPAAAGLLPAALLLSCRRRRAGRSATEE